MFHNSPPKRAQAPSQQPLPLDHWPLSAGQAAISARGQNIREAQVKDFPN
ncbi:predicted protein [Plenodomus lingam JN3]|uniref:Predicted protein n=1 Tax=Leptosphaeria maculans (strain JN3 / isolate v23.1.3 / race Av1-4-5-6-7-8) TaxID=985895 RepID=E5R5F5_LEPMJ|nr:predicted protein [Plenodomus lingam JN3]CBX92125.1 predicted protein [Plenodomus lingam JN3]